MKTAAAVMKAATSPKAAMKAAAMEEPAAMKTAAEAASRVSGSGE